MHNGTFRELVWQAPHCARADPPSLLGVRCLQDERIIGFIALGAAALLLATARPLGRRWSFEIPGVPFLSGWTFLACCAAAFAAFFLATGYELIPFGALAGCD